MTTLKIAGVPEHFNLPWHLCIENGDFERQGLDIQWTDVPEGTGRLCQMLRDGETDIAVMLTEGIIKDLATYNHSKIVQIYVESPLLWGIHVAAASLYKELADIEHGKVAISRYGSGSHLMAIVNAKQQGWNTENIDFEIINTLDGAIQGLTEGRADYFMWEHFMTKPIVDKGIFRRIADCPTPWPCFVIAVHNEVIENQHLEIGMVLDTINNMTTRFKDIPGIETVLAERYHQKTDDIAEWLKLTQWSKKQIDRTTFEKVQDELFGLNLITTKAAYETSVI